VSEIDTSFWRPEGRWSWWAELPSPDGGEPIRLLLFAEKLGKTVLFDIPVVQWRWEVSLIEEGKQGRTVGSGTPTKATLPNAARECRLFAAGFVAGMKRRGEK